MKTQRIIALFGALAALTLTACQKPTSSDGMDFADGEFGWGGSGGGSDWSGSGSGTLPSRDGGYSFFGPGSGNVMKGQFPPVYFGFDSFDVDGPELSKVRRVADYAKQNGAKLLVAGFTDSVGTEEYNRGLGDRRALSVRQALVRAGVRTSSIQTVSFGEEMLADSSNPTSGRNRRVEFGVVR
ncbi:MAG: OmpA family protein [Verrucomicrobiota bacterium]